MMRPPEAGGTVIVRLSSVSRDLRVQVAEQIIERGRLRGIDAFDLMAVAYSAKPDATITVSAEKARRVLDDGKLPAGPMPRVWAW